MDKSGNTREAVPFLIQCATGLEFESLRQALRAQDIRAEGKRKYFSASNTVVISGGLGAAAASKSLVWALDRWAPALVVDFGAAGALDPELGVGTLVVVTEVVQIDGRASAVTETAVFESLDSKKGRVVSVSHQVETKYDRASLVRQTAAVAVTWETATLAQVCAQKSVAFASLRVITDVGNGDLWTEYQANAMKVLVPAAKLIVDCLIKHQERR